MTTRPLSAFVSAFSSLLLVSPALADMCALVPRPVADAALKKLPKGTVVQSFCAPCNDTKAKRLVVQTADVQPDGSDFKVRINGTDEDIAYLYVRDGNAWVNLGALVNCGAESESDIPRQLTAAQVDGA